MDFTLDKPNANEKKKAGWNSLQTSCQEVLDITYKILFCQWACHSSLVLSPFPLACFNIWLSIAKMNKFNLSRVIKQNDG